MNYSYKLDIGATSAAEADQKATALASLAARLDGRTLEALALKVPSILSNPMQSSLVRRALGL